MRLNLPYSLRLIKQLLKCQKATVSGFYLVFLANTFQCYALEFFSILFVIHSIVLPMSLTSHAVIAAYAAFNWFIEQTYNWVGYYKLLDDWIELIELVSVMIKQLMRNMIENSSINTFICLNIMSCLILNKSMFKFTLLISTLVQDRLLSKI